MRILFVTGTDTGVGKTVVTALVTALLKQRGARVRALKPFCSGERTDAFLLCTVQGEALSLDEVNPFYFCEPVSPWTAGRKSGRPITLEQTLDHIRAHATQCDLLLVEGAGGLLSPLGERFNSRDLIVELGAEVIVVAPNSLGVLNHTLLTVEAMAGRNIQNVKIALNDAAAEDPSTATNQDDLSALLPKIPLIRIPFIANYRPEPTFLGLIAQQLRSRLDHLIS